MTRKFLVTSLSFIVLLTFFSSIVSAAENYELYIAQGIEKINEGKYSEALGPLQKALELSPDNPEAIYYTAIAYSRMGRLSEAESLLQKIKKDEKYAENVYLELGRIYYAKHECKKAEGYLSQFKSLSVETASKDYAESLIGACYGRAVEKKPYKVDITVGSQYDSNVVLEPTNPAVTAARKRDGRLVALISAGARVYEHEVIQLDINYSIYQSLHIHLNNFNVHYHNISPEIKLNVSDIIKPSAGYRLEYIYFGGDTYGVIHTSFANVNIKETEDLSADAIYEYRHNKYWDTEEFTSNSDRTGGQHTIGLKQNFTINKLKGDIHYFYDDKRAKAAHWAYIGHKIGASVGYRIIEPLMAEFSVDFNRRRHRAEFPSYGETRVDEMQKYTVNLQYALNNRMAITLTESYTVNDSNLRDYDYKRNIVGILLSYGLL